MKNREESCELQVSASSQTQADAAPTKRVCPKLPGAGAGRGRTSHLRRGHSRSVSRTRSAVAQNKGDQETSDAEKGSVEKVSTPRRAKRSITPGPRRGLPVARSQERTSAFVGRFPPVDRKTFHSSSERKETGNNSQTKERDDTNQ